MRSWMRSPTSAEAMEIITRRWETSGYLRVSPRPDASTMYGPSYPFPRGVGVVPPLTSRYLDRTSTPPIFLAVSDVHSTPTLGTVSFSFKNCVL